MTDLARTSLLNEQLGAALSASNQLVADLCEPVEHFGLCGDEHRALLLLWETDGMSEGRLAARLRVSAVDAILDALEHKGLVERTKRGADVWLTREGRRLRDVAGTEEMSTRFRLLKEEIVALRDALYRTLDLLVEESPRRATAGALA